MNPLSFPLLLSLLLLLPAISHADETEGLIEMLNRDIEQSGTAAEQATLYVYRARQYMKVDQWDKAEEDYEKALKLNHKGWIHLERSHFFMARKKYPLAYEEARTAKEEVPTLAHEADNIMKVAGAEIRRKYEAENPPTIIMDGRVDPKRKTRFDVMRAQGVFAAKATTYRKAGQQRAKPKTRGATVSQAPRKSRG